MNPDLIRLLPLLLWLVDFSKAAPIRDESTASNWLACLTALLIFSVVCLLAFKLLFLRYRRKSTLRGPGPVIIGNSYVNRYVHLSKSCTKSTKCKAGFLVGFAGSPAFETGSKPSEITLVYTRSEVSKSTNGHDLSLETTTSNRTKRSVGSLIGPVILFKEQRGYWETKDKSQDIKQPLKRSKPYFTLPRQFSFDLGRLRRKKQPTTSERDTESLPWPHNLLQHATHHMVNLYSESELPPSKSVDTDKLTLPFVTGSNGLEITVEEYRQPTPVSPSLDLPDQGQRLRLDIPSLHPEKRSSPSQICHPYNQPSAMFLKPSPGRYTRRASLSPSLSVIEEYCQSNVPDCMNELGVINYSLPRSPLLDQNQVRYPSEVSVASVKSPPTAYNGYDSLRRRERVKASSIRSRRSPPLGPSPLRSMILPDYTNGNRDTENIPARAQHSRTARNSYRNLGLGLPSIALNGVEDGGKRASVGTENMLDFLRQLAEETKDWDESIALNEGFKSMIQQTKPASGLNCGLLEEGCSTSTPTFPTNKDQDKRRSPPPFVSFWLEDTPSS